MADDAEIVIIGHPDQTVPSGYTPPAIPPSGPTGGGATQIIKENTLIAGMMVTIDPDASDEEIVVTANKFKNKALTVLTAAQRLIGTTVDLPCVGPQPGANIKGIIANLRFRAMTKNFGTNRAGENQGREGVSDIPVDMNAEQFKKYGRTANDQGLLYLIAHEAAHSFKGMRDFNQASFASFRAGAGANLTYDQAKAAFAETPAFAENEARANRIAKGIVDKLNEQLNVGNLDGYNPRFGYSTQC